MRKRARLARHSVAIGLLSIVTLSAFACSSSGSAGNTEGPGTTSQGATTAGGPPSSASQWPSNVTDYVAYTGGTSGAADMSLPPVRVGWVNNEGGSITPLAPSTTDAARIAVKYVNEHLGGIGGHPLALDECPIRNSEEEGLKCAQDFLSKPDVYAVAYGGVQVGADTLANTIDGKLPIIQSVTLNPGDATNKNGFILFGASKVTLPSQGQFNKNFLHGNSVAVIYATDGGNALNAQFVQQGMEVSGLQSKLVGFNSKQGDLTGALVAAGALDADVINLILSGGDCIKAANALKSLGITNKPVVSFTNCVVSNLKDAYPGGDFPADWYFNISQAGDQLLTDPPSPAGQTFAAMLEAYGQEKNATDNWWTATTSEIFTITKFLNEVGYDNLSPEAVAEKAKAFRGPLMLGNPEIECGKYPSLPASCSDGMNYFQYKGNGKFIRVGDWQYAPDGLRAELAANSAIPAPTR